MTTAIRPGLMISLKTTVRGGVSYQRENLPVSNELAAKDGKAVEKWETTKVVEDPEEHERARKAVNKARSLISSVCANTAFGLICPQEREQQLDEAITAARKLVGEFNASATFTHARIYALKGRIASTEEESAKAIGEEVASLIAAMNAGIEKLDVDAIRDAATKAKQLEELLGPEQASAVSDAVAQARKAARQIVKRVQNDGEAAAVVLKDLQRGSLEKARIAFLDFEDGTVQAPAGDSMPAANVQRVAELDLDFGGAPAPTATATTATNEEG